MIETILDSNAIQKIIPHRYPMLLIDRVIELEPGQKATAIRNVTINEEVFNGHFPQNPVLPGALIVESLAQTGEACPAGRTGRRQAVSGRPDPQAGKPFRG